jgi:hypothetical protein
MNDQQTHSKGPGGRLPHRLLGIVRPHPARFDETPPAPRSGVWIAVFVGIALWSLFAWFGYASADAVLDWLASNVGRVVEGGKDLAGAVGFGKEAGSLAERLNASGFLGQVIKLLHSIFKPLIVVVWGLGVLALLAAPLLAARVRRFSGRRH